MVALVAAFSAMGASQCTKAVRPDISSVFAAEANDVTVILEGCGSQPVVGYAYCRMREGQTTDGKFTLIAPPSDCAGESCVQFTLFFPDGSPSLSFMLPKKQTRQDVLWRDIVKTPIFQKNQRGFWPVLMRWKWLAPDGKEYESIAEGEIRLRVLSSNYLPLHEFHEDQNFAWKWSDGPMNFRMTTAGRASAWRD